MINYILDIEKFNENFEKIDNENITIDLKEIRYISILQEIWDSLDCSIDFFNKLTMEDIDAIEKILEDSYSYEMSSVSNEEKFKYDDRTVNLLKSIQQTERFSKVIDGVGTSRKARQADLF